MKKYYKFLTVIFLTMGSQSLFYYLIKFFISDYNLITSFIDMPYIDYFIYFYNSWYPFILLCVFLIYKHDIKLFTPLIFTMLLTAFMAQITFIIYPTIVIRPSIEVNNLTSWIVNLTYKIDSPAINCLPSMHCIYCFVTSYYILKCKNLNIKTKILITIYSSIIVLSTLLVKQHIIEDVILAFIYTTLVIFIANKPLIIKLINKIKNTNN